MTRTLAALLVVAAPAALAAPTALSAQAQTSPGYAFLEAVKKADGGEVTRMLGEPGQVVNSRDRSTGETALHIVTRAKNEQWIGFLLYRGANPNIGDHEGTTPLMLAVMLDFPAGVDRLIAGGARVDEPNRRGETPLIRAVQLRQPDMVRRLVAAGADPARTDSVAGLSARDYALREGRNGELVELLDAPAAPKPDKPVFGPSL